MLQTICGSEVSVILKASYSIFTFHNFIGQIKFELGFKFHFEHASIVVKARARCGPAMLVRLRKVVARNNRYRLGLACNLAPRCGSCHFAVASVS